MAGGGIYGHWSGSPRRPCRPPLLHLRCPPPARHQVRPPPLRADHHAVPGLHTHPLCSIVYASFRQDRQPLHPRPGGHASTRSRTPSSIPAACSYGSLESHKLPAMYAVDVDESLDLVVPAAGGDSSIGPNGGNSFNSRQTHKLKYPRMEFQNK
jgi:hypothetical protein